MGSETPSEQCSENYNRGTSAGTSIDTIAMLRLDMNNQRLVHWVIVTFREAAWAPLGVIGFYAVGLALDLYDSFRPLDIPSHLLGGAAITYFCRSAMRNSQSIIGDIPSLIQVLLAFSCTGTTIIFWEFYENALDFFSWTHTWCGDSKRRSWICFWV